MGKKTLLSRAKSFKARLTEHEPTEATLQIENQLGMHARAAAAFVKVANRFHAEVLVCKGTVRVNGKSIMGVLMLAAPKGTTITIQTSGPEAASCLAALCELVRNKFGEE